MSSLNEIVPPEQPPRRPFFRALFHGENFIVAGALAAMVILPLLEIVLRKLFKTGITGSTQFVQHCTLLVGMWGGAIAARENRLLSMAALPTLLKWTLEKRHGRLQRGGRIGDYGVPGLLRQLAVRPE